MTRLFVALETPPSLAASLLATLPRDRAIRSTPAAQVHLTLRFLGELDEGAALSIEAALATVAGAPFDMQLAGVGRFGRRGGILWAGVAPCHALMALHRAIDLTLAHAGIDPEPRPFHPHLTLARCAPHAPEPLLREWLAGQRALACAPYRVHRFFLYESRLHHHGAEHRCRRAFALQAPAPETDSEPGPEPGPVPDNPT